MAAPVGIVTPEAVVLEFDTAGIGSRLVAGVIDLCVQGALLVAVLVAAGFSVTAGVALGGMGAAVVYIAVFLVVFGYPAAFETLWNGRTPGKAALGLRVVTVEGAPVQFRHAAIRSILALVDWYGTQGAVGLVSLFVTRRNQRIGDLVAGTIVLRERLASRLERPVEFAPPPGLEAYAATLPGGAIGHEAYASIRSFLLRAPSLPDHIRRDLAAQLGYSVADRLRVHPPAGLDAEAFLVCVAAAHQRRARRGGVAAPPVFTSVWADPTP